MGTTSEELNQTKKELEKSKKERQLLKKAIWDMLNYANLYVVLLDKELNIRLVNYSLATKLGFKNEREPIGRCWLDFIKEEERIKIKAIHYDLSTNQESKFFEHQNEIITINGETILVKWFNTQINSHYNMTFSFGMPKSIPAEITEDSIRTYYREIVEKDKTMIRTLREAVLNGKDFSVCSVSEK
jgi:PAS domain S-box-containing protein